MENTGSVARLMSAKEACTYLVLFGKLNTASSVTLK